MPASYAPGAGSPAAAAASSGQDSGEGQGPGAGQGSALRGADFKWELGRRAIGLLAALAAAGGHGAAWAAAAARPLRAELAAAEAAAWRRVGHPLRCDRPPSPMLALARVSDSAGCRP